MGALCKKCKVVYLKFRIGVVNRTLSMYAKCFIMHPGIYLKLRIYFKKVTNEKKVVYFKKIYYEETLLK